MLSADQQQRSNHLIQFINFAFIKTFTVISIKDGGGPTKSRGPYHERDREGIHDWTTAIEWMDDELRTTLIN